ncbi:MAG: polysaccharide biosynthesis protein, partial [Clostridia bacterium]|nr:polysaccharide biosynthesis protein [Clostridia bacterium]
IRYFMTIPEAVQLVMQTGIMAKSGELFVLDMGKPIRILDLAENMIRLSGLVPYKDIDIVEIGLRPGEKLYEELLIKTENLSKTDNNMIFIERDAPPARADVEDAVAALSAFAKNYSDIGTEKVKEIMKTYVTTYRDPEDVNKDAEKADEMKMMHAES